MTASLGNDESRRTRKSTAAQVGVLRLGRAREQRMGSSRIRGTLQGLSLVVLCFEGSEPFGG